MWRPWSHQEDDINDKLPWFIINIIIFCQILGLYLRNLLSNINFLDRFYMRLISFRIGCNSLREERTLHDTYFLTWHYYDLQSFHWFGNHSWSMLESNSCMIAFRHFFVVSRRILIKSNLEAFACVYLNNSLNFVITNSIFKLFCISLHLFSKLSAACFNYLIRIIW